MLTSVRMKCVRVGISTKINKTSKKGMESETEREGVEIERFFNTFVRSSLASLRSVINTSNNDKITDHKTERRRRRREIKHNSVFASLIHTTIWAKSNKDTTLQRVLYSICHSIPGMPMPMPYSIDRAGRRGRQEERRREWDRQELSQSVARFFEFSQTNSIDFSAW